jgi:hypothetical protein
MLRRWPTLAPLTWQNTARADALFRAQRVGNRLLLFKNASKFNR